MDREEDKRDVIMADGSIVSRDLAVWMKIKDRINSRGNYLKERKEVELDSFHVG